MKPIIAPSLLSADFACLKTDIEMLNRSQADWIHLDVMDGQFVPNISFGFPIIKAIRKITKKPLDAHLMIVHPEQFITQFKEVGCNMLVVHWEACLHLHRVVTQIKAAGMLAGVAINPHTPVSDLEDIIDEANIVLLMSVNPGFGGQKFIERSLYRIATLHEMIDRHQSKTMIEVDGGINRDNARAVVQAGADVLVAGNSVFKATNPEEEINFLKNI